MDIFDLATKFGSLHNAIKILFSAVPFTLVALGYLHVRVHHQRLYIRAVRSLPRYLTFLRSRSLTLMVADTPMQFRLEQLEGRIASELNLNLRPNMTGWVSFINPGHRDYLRQAIRQLNSEVFRDFADDLLLRLILMLDCMADFENLRKRSRWTLDAIAHSRKRDELRQRLEDDFAELDYHIRIMKLYLSGELDPDICSPQESQMFRSLLEEKYKAYTELCKEDAELATSNVAN